MARNTKHRRGRRARPSFNDINMTPLLDLTFLLLIAFLITFPALEQGVALKLPSGKADALDQNKPLTISINGLGDTFIGADRVTEAQIVEALRRKRAETPDFSVLIRGDENQAYGRIMDVVKLLHREKVTRMALVTEGK